MLGFITGETGKQIHVIHVEINGDEEESNMLFVLWSMVKVKVNSCYSCWSL